MARFTASIRSSLIVVSLLTMTSAGCGRPQVHKEVNVAEARALTAEGKKALAGGDMKKAANLFDQAIALIGSSYARPDLLDDSGLKLVLSKAEARKSNWSVAAHLKENVVDSRLALLGGK
jgi:hypothetical protein